MVSYRFITTLDPEYAQEKELRDRVLRRPLGLALSEKDLQGEEQQTHIVAVDESGRVLGCVLISFVGGAAKARQLAVDASWRKMGIGRELMRRAEEAARERTFRKLILHGRAVNIPFFEKLGYAVVSEAFNEVTIPHVRLEKTL